MSTTATPGGIVSDAQVGQFRTLGYTTIEPLISAAAVDALRAAYDDILDRRVDCGAHDRRLGGVTRQVMVPHVHHPALRENEVWDGARAAAAALLGCSDTQFLFDMMIFKPPGHPEETPWHQDLAYSQRPVAPAGTVSTSRTVQVWVALDHADADNGCMHFIPGAHTAPMLEHHVASGDPADEGRLLAITDPERDLDLSRAVACPLAPGGATAHREGTPHYTPPNRTTDRARRAYILNFRDPHERLAGEHD